MVAWQEGGMKQLGVVILSLLVTVQAKRDEACFAGGATFCAKPPALPLDSLLINQPQIDLVNQSRRL